MNMIQKIYWNNFKKQKNNKTVETWNSYCAQILYYMQLYTL